MSADSLPVLTWLARDQQRRGLHYGCVKGEHFTPLVQVKQDCYHNRTVSVIFIFESHSNITQYCDVIKKINKNDLLIKGDVA